MRKIIALGAGVVATTSLALGVAAPANAVIAPPASLVNQVCAGLPAQITGAINALTQALGVQTAANTDLTNKTTAFNAAQTDLVAALVDYIQTVDSGGSVGAKATILGDKMAIYSDRAAAWGNAWSALDAANRQVAINGMTNSVLSGLTGGLSC